MLRFSPLVRALLFYLCLIPASGGPLPAVEGAAVAVRGKVLDPARAPIAGARVGALANGNIVASTVTDSQGAFWLALSPGAYALEITAQGFGPASQALAVRGAESSEIELILEIAVRTDTLVVVDDTPYQAATISSVTKVPAPLRDVPQSITVVTRELMRDQLMLGIGDVVRYVPGITAIQGENNRDQLVIRGNSTSADFFVNGVRDDVQYYRDLYNLERVEALKGPNALIFGRGGAGGVVNRVTKEAGFTPLRELTLQGGAFGQKRFATDFDQPLNSKAAFRLNGVYESSGSFRDAVNLERYGVAPALTIAPSATTRLKVDYEHFRDRRVADRGVPSFRGRPADVGIDTFFGNPDDSRVLARVHIGSTTIEHQAGELNIQNHTLVGDYDRSYQNYVPGPVTPDRTQVQLSAYNNAAHRTNLFNQTDLVRRLATGRLRHTLVGGVEIGRQVTENLRNTGYFNNSATTVLVPYSDPRTDLPVVFRQSATDADNHVRTSVAGVYLQDHVVPSRWVQLIAGVRLSRFDLQYHNNRTREDLRRIDTFAAPRAGIVFKPATAISLYGSYGVSHLPSSGDQFSSLTAITQQVKPERFDNYEVGAKVDLRRALSFTAALYRLDRTNTRATDPNDPTRIVQTGSQRTNGCEIALSGSITRAWKVAGGYAYQHAFVTSATAAARAGAVVAQVPRHTVSMWHTYQVHPRIGFGLGLLHRSDMFAAIDDTVTLPGYARADAAVFFSITERMRLQANVENVLDRKYYVNADSNNNISPGSPRALRFGFIARF
jgi:catecholate siderophore receptor